MLVLHFYVKNTEVAILMN